MTATHCAKTLISAAAAGNVPVQQSVKFLLPGMIAYVAQAAGQKQAGVDAESGEVNLPGVEELLKAFSTLFLSFPEATRECPVHEDSLTRTNIYIIQAHMHSAFSCPCLSFCLIAHHSRHRHGFTLRL